MLPGSRSVDWWTMSMVTSPACKGDDHAAADAAGDTGPRRPGRAGTPLPHHPRRRDPDRYQMVLLNAQGHTPPQIARLVRCSPDTVRRVLNRYLGGGPDAVPHRPHPGQPPHYPPAWEAELVRVADCDPRSVGVDSALWTCRLLADYLQGVTGHAAGIETVRIALHRAGYVCKRPRWVLTRKAQAQPGWAKNA